MKLTVANVDRSGDLGKEITDSAVAMAASADAPDFLQHDYSVLSLRSAANEEDFLNRLIRLMWARTGVCTGDFYIPRRRGVLGSGVAAVRRFLWKLLRYQHDRVVFQQITINTQLTTALELMRTEYARKTAALEQRIGDLENKAAGNQRRSESA